LRARILEAFETGPGIPIKRKAFLTMIAGRIRTIERSFAFPPVETDEITARTRAPHDPILVDIATSHADSSFRDGIELAELRLRIEAHEAGSAGEHANGVPDRTVTRMRHHRIGARAGIDAAILAGFARLAGVGPLVELA